MKTKLLIGFFFISVLSYSQNIVKFTSNPNTNFSLLSPASSLNQSPTGANVTWTFSGLTENGATTDSYTTPSLEDATNYPGTTKTLSITTAGNPPTINKLYLSENGSDISITGISQGNIVLNYNTTNAFIGTFPMNFGTSNTTNVSGTWSLEGVANGIFTGTITTSVDAHGTLNYGDYSEAVTRLSISQQLNAYPDGIPLSFLLNQTNYYYYNNRTNNIDFRYQYIDIPSLNNAKSETLEYNATSGLSLNEDTLTSSISIYPNPAKDFIHITLPNKEAIKSLKIIDCQGRKVLVNNPNTKNINTSNLQTGLYFLSIETLSGKLANKKFIKY